jgi:hypothetical protein
VGEPWICEAVPAPPVDLLVVCDSGVLGELDWLCNG